MSRKHSTHSHHASRTTQVTPAISIQELEAHWNSLHLHPRTKDHLEHILQVEGVGLALAATIALDLERQREEQKVTQSLGGWIIEELRLLFLEEGCQHIIETSRLIIDASLTWTVLRGPFLMKYLVFLLIALGVFLIFCCLLSGYRHHRRRRKKD